ncbi:Uncharacterised protein [Vibrio cholerae]|uniref:Uncharacterized protein n=1 Tax=Vibrio cholerae TaxID=666 RepID=A0A655WQU5_VIBCL|nr:Uncharacterised protein [Vibrio cholerae]CSA32183.1 Uncharacterised protein [Vibrio cholerae]CSB23770.1 Uncharacterised protein [Vibrio cholerae]CSB33609.1 Uncharacterised protein [Vibrio cholerae]CSB96609.1 Uncharacterised protein [Vibrio cholerae]
MTLIALFIDQLHAFNRSQTIKIQHMRPVKRAAKS